MGSRSPVIHAIHSGFVVLVCLGLLTGCVELDPTDPNSGPTTGTPVTDYETFVFDLTPSSESVIAGGIAVDAESGDQHYVTLITSTAETDRFDRSLLPPDAGEFVNAVSFESELLVVMQTFPASSVPDYRVESIARDGPTLHVSINDTSDGGTDDVTVETILVRLPGETPDNVIVTTEDGDTFEIGGDR